MVKPFELPDGVGAEVRVQINSGTVTELDTKDSGNVHVKFEVKGFDWPVQGWTSGAETAVLNLLNQARSEGTPIEFRIESQRKSSVDPTIPIKDVIAAGAAKNVRSILSAVRLSPTDEWTFSSERVTNPALDKAPGGRNPAPLGEEASTSNAHSQAPSQAPVQGSRALEVLRTAAAAASFSEPVLAQLAALALASGESPQQVHEALYGVARDGKTQPPLRASFSVEAPAWKDYNSDGHQNLGRAGVQAAIGVERFVSKQLPEAAEQLVRQYVRALLTLADVVQQDAYGSGFRADRSAASHSVIRSVIYDTLEKTSLPEQFPETAWWVGLRERVTSRYNLAIDVADAPAQLDLFGAPAAPAARAPQPQATASAPVAAPTAPKAAQPAPTAPEPADAEGGFEYEEESSTPSAQDAASFTQAVQDLDSNTDSDTSFGVEEETTEDASIDPVDDDVLFPPQILVDEGLLEADTGNIKKAFAPSPSVRSEFGDYLSKADITPDLYPQMIALLKNTFGPKFGKASNIPSENLGFFIDHFAELGNGDPVKGPKYLKLAVERTSA